MNSPDLPWLGDVPEIDAEHVAGAPGGALSELGRQAAIEASLELLGVYFAGGKQEIAVRPAIAVSDHDTGLNAVQAGLRLRVALAAGRRLIPLLGLVTKHPTFRYGLRRTEHVGSLSGALDVNRWMTRRRGDDEDVTFPVQEVTRSSLTPENVLASYAALWLIRELKVSLSACLATRDAVEYRAVRTVREQLERLLRSPALAACAHDARLIRTQSASKRLIERVKRRLRRRDIAHPGPYRDLVEWMDRCLQGHPSISAGEIDLSVYGTRFDNKLFELWCLRTLSRQLASKINVPNPIINPKWRRTAPAYRLDTFSGRIEVFFQRGVAAVEEHHEPKWRKSSGRPLGGIPDIVVRGTATGGSKHLAIVDPKLRQRDRLPAEELYKILGYLQNFEILPSVGVVLLYTTDIKVVVPDVFHDGAGGTLISASLNPAAPESVTSAALEDVVKAILKLIDFDLPADDGGSKIDDPSDESTIERTITTVRHELLAWGRGHLSELEPSRERIRTLVGEDRWSSLDGDVQTMVATADLVGYQVDPTADFSGPVIGMCSAIEHIIYGAVLSPIIGENRDWHQQTRTLGAAIDIIEHACLRRGGQLPSLVRRHMDSLPLDIERVQALVPSWRELNRRYRVPAAHRKVLTKPDWQQLYRLVMGSESLFVQTYDSLIGSVTGEQNS